ncbi:uncharacterized protein G2W53_027186 [Senna tora]|uniref:Uncharacterized protein n=1 Tax=Senna tora TaxID=362788 RepID=A0A834TIG9_9FABA|nr:uncharacterized protein G2W53_027186 [Senna tora]
MGVGCDPFIEVLRRSSLRCDPKRSWVATVHGSRPINFGVPTPYVQGLRVAAHSVMYRKPPMILGRRPDSSAQFCLLDYNLFFSSK